MASSAKTRGFGGLEVQTIPKQSTVASGKPANTCNWIVRRDFYHIYHLKTPLPSSQIVRLYRSFKHCSAFFQHQLWYGQPQRTATAGSIVETFLPTRKLDFLCDSRNDWYLWTTSGWWLNHRSNCENVKWDVCWNVVSASSENTQSMRIYQIPVWIC